MVIAFTDEDDLLVQTVSDRFDHEEEDEKMASIAGSEVSMSEVYGPPPEVLRLSCFLTSQFSFVCAVKLKGCANALGTPWDGKLQLDTMNQSRPEGILMGSSTLSYWLKSLRQGRRNMARLKLWKLIWPRPALQMAKRVHLKTTRWLLTLPRWIASVDRYHSICLPSTDVPIPALTADISCVSESD
jgi:hypothetical protein